MYVSNVVEIWWVDLIYIIPFLGAALAGLIGLFDRRLAGLIGVTSIFISSLLTIPLLVDIISDPSRVIVSPSRTWFIIPSLSPGMQPIPVYLSSYLDGLSIIMSFMVAWISLLIALYSLKYMEGDYGEHRYWLFFTFFVGSMLMLVMTSNIILFIIGWEGTSLASYALIGHWYRDDDENTFVGDRGRKALGRSMFFSPSHSGVRAIVMTGAADIGLLIGLGLILVSTGTTSIPDLYSSSSLASLFNYLASLKLLPLFLFILSLGALAKSAQFPLHEWLVTAMTGPASVSALIHAATMVKAGVYFMLRFSPIFLNVSSAAGDLAILQVREYFTLIMILGAFTAFMMATMAVVARELKLIWAFSTASQIGYMFAATASSGVIGEPGLGIVAGFSHLLSHAVFKAALFLAAGAMIHAVNSRFINDMKGLARYMRITISSSYIAALSLASVPPLAGFWSKDLVLESVGLSPDFLVFLLLVITAFITAFYSIRAIGYTFMSSENVEKMHSHEPHLLMYLPYLILAIASIVLGFFWWFYSSVFARIVLTTLPLPHSDYIMTIHFDPGIAMLSIAVSISGVMVAVVLYQIIKKEVYGYLAGSTVLRGLHSFLYDRWYYNSILYMIFVEGFSGLIRVLGSYVESMGIDGFYHRVLARFGSLISRGLRSIQIGFVNMYLIAIIIGILILILVGWGVA